MLAIGSSGGSASERETITGRIPLRVPDVNDDVSHWEMAGCVAGVEPETLSNEEGDRICSAVRDPRLRQSRPEFARAGMAFQGHAR